MFENWQKLVSSQQKLILFMRKSLTTLLKQNEKSPLTTYGKIDCTEYYVKVKNFFKKITAKPKPIFSNITKEERKVLKNLKKDDNHMVLTAEKGVASVIINKDMYSDRSTWPYLMMRKYAMNGETK